MKILVTGGAGLIGSHLVDDLLAAGHDVVAIDDLSFGSRRNIHLAVKSKAFVFVHDDVRGLDSNHEKYDAIFHLASLKKVWDGSIKSSTVMDVNFEMTKCVVRKCLRDNSVLIFASTSDVYGNSTTFKEDNMVSFGPPTNIRYSYALSKLHSEQYILNDVQENGLKAAIIRVFGCASSRSNRGWSGGHVPLFIDLALRGQDICIHGNGKQTRSISHAKDIATGFVGALHEFDKLNGQIVNIGTDQQTTVEYIAEYVVEKICSHSRIIYDAGFLKDYNEITVRYADVQKACGLFGFKIRYSTEQVIDEIINEWKRESIIG